MYDVVTKSTNIAIYPNLSKSWISKVVKSGDSFNRGVVLNKALPTTVDGVKLFNPGILLTFFVGFILFFFAYIVLKIENGILFLVIVFVLRAVGNFHYIGFFKKVKSTPFAIYDTKYFSPLCLYLAISLAFIAYNV